MTSRGFALRVFEIVHSVLFAALLFGCEDFRECPAPSSTRIEQAPRLLSETGLYADIASDLVADDVRPFRPSFELWSDGAVKRRWIYLPPGSTIDTSDVDDWQLPEGTRLWKEFTRDDVRVETRMLERVGPNPSDWVAVAYLWNQDGTDAERITNEVTDARGTAHDVPAAAQCWGCHGGRSSVVLGFSAIQLDHSAPDGEWTLSRLADDGRLSGAVDASLTIPGDDTARAALGYLHANCGHCHNQERPTRDGPRCFDPENELDFWLRTGALETVRDTPAWRSAVGSVIQPGDADHSVLIRRASRRGAGQMPPLGTEKVDDAAIMTLRAWVDSL